MTVKVADAQYNGFWATSFARSSFVNRRNRMMRPRASQIDTNTRGTYDSSFIVAVESAQKPPLASAGEISTFEMAQARLFG